MTETSPDVHYRVGPVPVDRFLWERLMMMSDLPREDRFKLLALGMFMDGATGGGARPGAANLALFGHHEETWKVLLRRAVAAGWLILRERGGSRKGPGGTRIRRASMYAASVPADVFDRRWEILERPPFRALGTKEASGEPAPRKQARDGSSKEARDGSSKEAPGRRSGGGLPSTTAGRLNEAPDASFNGPCPVDNPAAPGYAGSPTPHEGSPCTLPSHDGGSTKEASAIYEGSADGLRRKSHCASPSISPPSRSTSSIRSDLIDPTATRASDPGLDAAVQHRKAVRWLGEHWHLDPDTAAAVIDHVQADAHARGIPIRWLPGYLAKMHTEGDLADIVGAALDLAEGRTVPWGAPEDLHTPAPQPEPEPDQEPEPPPLRALPGNPAPSGPIQPPMLQALPGGAAPAPRDLGLPPDTVTAALGRLTMRGGPYRALAARYFHTRGITPTDDQLKAYALQLAWDTPKDRNALRHDPAVAAALDQTG